MNLTYLWLIGLLAVTGCTSSTPLAEQPAQSDDESSWNERTAARLKQMEQPDGPQTQRSLKIDATAGPLGYAVWRSSYIDKAIVLTLLVVSGASEPVTVPQPLLLDAGGRRYEMVPPPSPLQTPREAMSSRRYIGPAITGVDRLNPRGVLIGKAIFEVPREPGYRLLVRGPDSETAELPLPIK